MSFRKSFLITNLSRSKISTKFLLKLKNKLVFKYLILKIHFFFPLYKCYYVVGKSFLYFYIIMNFYVNIFFLSAETCETELLPPSSIAELPEKLLTSGVYLPGEHPSACGAHR